MARKLRIAVSVFFGLLTVALCVLWVRSHRHRDELNFRFWPTRAFEAISFDSRLDFIVANPISKWPNNFNSHTREEYEKISAGGRSGYFGANSFSGPRYRVAIPHLVLLVPVLFLAAWPWRSWPYTLGLKIPHQFSLRTLLITTTLLAIVLGLIIGLTP